MPYCRSSVWEVQMPSNTALMITATMPNSKARVRYAPSELCQPIHRRTSAFVSRWPRDPRALKAGHTWDSESLARKSDSSQTCEEMSSAPEDDRLISCIVRVSVVPHFAEPRPVGEKPLSPGEKTPSPWSVQTGLMGNRCSAKLRKGLTERKLPIPLFSPALTTTFSARLC